jgi:hypothetical protein
MSNRYRSAQRRILNKEIAKITKDLPWDHTMESWPGEYPPSETSVVLTLNFAHFREDSSRAKAALPRRHADTPIQSPYVVAAMPRCDLLLKICLRGLLSKPEPGANHCGDSERSTPACFSH